VSGGTRPIPNLYEGSSHTSLCKFGFYEPLEVDFGSDVAVEASQAARSELSIPLLPDPPLHTLVGARPGHI
jgi:hypothetical protein